MNTSRACSASRSARAADRVRWCRRDDRDPEFAVACRSRTSSTLMVDFQTGTTAAHFSTIACVGLNLDHAASGSHRRERVLTHPSCSPFCAPGRGRCRRAGKDHRLSFVAGVERDVADIAQRAASVPAAPSCQSPVGYRPARSSISSLASSVWSGAPRRAARRRRTRPGSLPELHLQAPLARGPSWAGSTAARAPRTSAETHLPVARGAVTLVCHHAAWTLRPERSNTVRSTATSSGSETGTNRATRKSNKISPSRSGDQRARRRTSAHENDAPGRPGARPATSR